jgi:hypothetical protein
MKSVGKGCYIPSLQFPEEPQNFGVRPFLPSNILVSDRFLPSNILVSDRFLPIKILVSDEKSRKFAEKSVSYG